MEAINLYLSYCCVCRKRELVRETERGRVRDRERERG